MPCKDPEKRRAWKRAYYAANREKLAARGKLDAARYREANRELLAAKQLVYAAAHREQERERSAAWRVDNPERTRRRDRLRKWEAWGVNPWPYASLGELHDNRYIVAEHCDYCGVAFAAIVSRHSPLRLDHDHDERKFFRAVCCNRCNISRGYWDSRIALVNKLLNDIDSASAVGLHNGPGQQVGE